MESDKRDLSKKMGKYKSVYSEEEFAARKEKTAANKKAKAEQKERGAKIRASGEKRQKVESIAGELSTKNKVGSVYKEALNYLYGGKTEAKKNASDKPFKTSAEKAAEKRAEESGKALRRAMKTKFGTQYTGLLDAVKKKGVRESIEKAVVAVAKKNNKAWQDGDSNAKDAVMKGVRKTLADIRNGKVKATSPRQVVNYVKRAAMTEADKRTKKQVVK